MNKFIGSAVIILLAFIAVLVIISIDLKTDYSQFFFFSTEKGKIIS